MLTNEEVVEELLKMVKDIATANAGELAFYDVLTKPQAVKDFYEHEELIAITKELTISCEKTALLKRVSAPLCASWLSSSSSGYPPEGMDNAVQIVIYSVVETAKTNGLKPFEYFNFLLEALPTGNPPQDCLPWMPIAQNLR